MNEFGQDTLKTRKSLKVAGRTYDYFSFTAAAKAGLRDIERLPYSLKVLLENLLRAEDGATWPLVLLPDAVGFDLDLELIDPCLLVGQLLLVLWRTCRIRLSVQ